MKGAARDASEGRPGVMISQSFQTVERVAGEMGLPKWGIARVGPVGSESDPGAGSVSLRRLGVLSSAGLPPPPGLRNTCRGDSKNLIEFIKKNVLVLSIHHPCN